MWQLCERRVLGFSAVPLQEFFSLAWSTVLMSTGNKNAAAQPCSILAAGGKRGVVKLIHPRNNVAYGEFRASRKALSVLRFNHREGNFLFSKSFAYCIDSWLSPDIYFSLLCNCYWGVFILMHLVFVSQIHLKTPSFPAYLYRFIQQLDLTTTRLWCGTSVAWTATTTTKLCACQHNSD